jgi:hypothetical protein
MCATARTRGSNDRTRGPWILTLAPEPRVKEFVAPTYRLWRQVRWSARGAVGGGRRKQFHPGLQSGGGGGAAAGGRRGCSKKTVFANVSARELLSAAAGEISESNRPCQVLSEPEPEPEPEPAVAASAGALDRAAMIKQVSYTPTP